MRNSYWWSVLAEVWDKTYKPLGWDKKKIALVLIAACAVIVTGIHLGLAAMIASAVADIWVVAPVLLAAFVLFAWGMFQTQAEMYITLSDTSGAAIAELNAALSKAKEPPPNYEVWRHKEILTVWEAAFLWSELEPRLSMSSKVRPWYNGLCGAI